MIQTSLDKLSRAKSGEIKSIVKQFSSEERATEMLHILLCSIIIICRLKFIQIKSPWYMGHKHGCSLQQSLRSPKLKKNSLLKNQS